MKNLLISLVLCVFSFVSIIAQSGKDSGYDVAVKYGNSVYFYSGTAADTLGVSDSTWSKTVLWNTEDEIIFDVYFDIDSTGGTSSAANAQLVMLRGKQFPDEAWTYIDTVTYQGAADTTFTMSSSSAAKYRYTGVYIEGKTDEFKSEVQKVYFHKLK